MGDTNPSIRTGAVAFLDSLGTKGTWLKEGPEEALRRRTLNLQNAKDRLSERAFKLFQLTSTFSTAASGVLPTSEITGWFSDESLGAPVGGGAVSVDGVFQPDSSARSFQFAWTLPEDPSGLHSEFLAFSDTIIALRWGETDEVKLLTEFCRDLIDVFNQSLNEQILYRGVVTFGQFLYSDPILLGPAVDDAALWFEIADWMGIHLTPTTTFWLKARTNEVEDASKVFADYQLPLRKSAEPNTSLGKSTVLAWPRFFEGGRLKLFDLFAQQLVDPKIASKYDNTLKFFEKVTEHAPP